MILYIISQNFFFIFAIVFLIKAKNIKIFWRTIQITKKLSHALKVNCDMIQIFSFKYLQDISFNTHTALKQKCHPCSFHSINPPIQAYNKPYMAVDVQSLIFQQPNFLTRTEINVFRDESKFWDNPTLCYPLTVKGQN